MTTYTACTVTVGDGTTSLLLTRYEPGPIYPGGPDQPDGHLAAWQQILLPDTASLRDVRDELERHGYTASRDAMMSAERKSPDYFAFQVVRLPVTGVVAQLADLPPADRLVALQALPAEVDVMMRAAVAELRAAGTSWQAIGDILGVSRQSAHERFASR